MVCGVVVVPSGKTSRGETGQKAKHRRRAKARNEVGMGMKSPKITYLELKDGVGGGGCALWEDQQRQELVGEGALLDVARHRDARLLVAAVEWYSLWWDGGQGARVGRE